MLWSEVVSDVSTLAVRLTALEAAMVDALVAGLEDRFEAAVAVSGLDSELLSPKIRSGRGRPPTLLRRDAGRRPFWAKALAEALSAKAWRAITWRQGTNERLTSRFARVRVRPARRDDERRTPHPRGAAVPTRASRPVSIDTLRRYLALAVARRLIR
jgi:hypothetical protein